MEVRACTKSLVEWIDNHSGKTHPIKQNDPRGFAQLHGGGDGSELEPLYGVVAGIKDY